MCLQYSSEEKKRRRIVKALLLKCKIPEYTFFSTFWYTDEISQLGGPDYHENNSTKDMLKSYILRLKAVKSIFLKLNMSFIEIVELHQ